MLWDLFCRVIDNHGDAGVCWRLAADLASRGEAVRLWIDDARALAWMAPQGVPGVAVHPWPVAQHDFATTSPGEVVIEAFGCELPAGFVAAMARQPRPPVWINLEYLSAEPYVEAAPARAWTSGSSTPASARAPVACCANAIWPSARQASTRSIGWTSAAGQHAMVSRWWRCSATTTPPCPG